MSFFIATGGSIPEMHTHTYNRDVFRCHLAAVEGLAAAGIPAPPEWTAVRERYTQYVELGDPSIDRLTAAIINGTGDLVALHNAAMVEELATAGADSAIGERIRAAVLHALTAAYKPAAKRNYAAAASRYDKGAKVFTDIAKTVDVEASGDTLIAASPAQRSAWIAAPEAAANLDQAAHTLFTAASLAGGPADAAFATQATDVATQEYQIALACDPGRSHRRRVWEAWSTSTGRTGKWGSLHRLGVELRAADDPARISPYERPVQPIAVTGPDSAMKWHDPYDGPIPPRHRPVAAGWLGETPTTSLP